MSALIEGVSIIGGSTLLSIVGIFLVRKKFSRASLEACHEVGGYLLAVVGTLYAILLGMIVVGSQAKVDQARQMAVAEANVLSNIYHLSRPFKEDARKQIRESLYHYALIAVSQDWPGIASGAEKEGTVPAYQELWKDITSYNPQEQNEQQCYSTMLSDMQQLSDARRFRMVGSREGLSSILWTVLIAGGILIVIFTYFFFVENVMSQILMTSFVVVFLALNVYLVYIYQNPYRPELGAKESGFGYAFTPEWFHDKPNKPEKKP